MIQLHFFDYGWHLACGPLQADDDARSVAGGLPRWHRSPPGMALQARSGAGIGFCDIVGTAMQKNSARWRYAARPDKRIL